MTKSNTAAARASDIPPGTTQRVVLGGKEILICNVDGTFYAIDDICTHDGGSLDQGDLEGDRIMCPRHGAYFDVKTGAALTLPAVLPVCAYKVTLEGDEISVET